MGHHCICRVRNSQPDDHGGWVTNKEGKWKLVLALTILGAVLLNVHWVSERIVSWEEGFHLYTAHQISEGGRIYADVFYVHLPLFPYLLAPLSSPGFQSLFIWRSIAAAVGVLLGLLILWFGLKVSSPRTALFAFFLYVINGTILGWHVVVHAGGFAEFAAFLSFLLLIYGIDRKSRMLFFASGAVLCLGVLLRVVYCPLLGIWIYLIFRSRDYRAALYLLGGVLVVSLFPGYFLIRNGENLIFQTLTFHLIRGRIWTNLTGLGEIWRQKAVALGKFFVLPQTLIIFCFSIAALYRYLSSRGVSHVRELTLMGGAFVLFVGHLLLVPVHFFYFVQSLPFLIAAGIPYLDHWLRERTRTVIGLVIAFYVVGLVPPYLVYVRVVRRSDEWKKIGNLRETIKSIRDLSCADDRIVSMNPSYLQFSGRKGSGLQPWLLEISPGLDEKQRRKYKVPDSVTVKHYIDTAKPALVVGDPGWELHGYSKITLPSAVIFRREVP